MHHSSTFTNQLATAAIAVTVLLLLVISDTAKALSLFSSGKSNTTNCYRYISSDTIYGLGDTFIGSEVVPYPKYCPAAPSCDLYITPASCLGWNGPIAAYGPLGTLGPLSHEIPSPSAAYALFQQYLKALLGPYYREFNPVIYNKENPLSSIGPLGDSFYNLMPSINDFTKHMQGLGVWSIMGPLGPLGPLGGLGPLGPVGIHEFTRNDDGDYVDSKGVIQRFVSVAWDDKKNVTWPLYEDYTKSRAMQLSAAGQLDTSFMVTTIGSLTPDIYVVNVTEPQFVSVLVVPDIYAKNFKIQVTEKKTRRVIAQSGIDTVLFNPWVQFYVSPENLQNGSLLFEISITVDPMDCGLLSAIDCFMSYYLHVVGSTKQMLRKPNINYSGKYIKTVCK